MKRVIPVLALVVVAVLIVTVWYPRWKAARNPRTEMHLSGNIEAHESVVGFRVQGRIVDLPIHEGQFVKAGEVLARLDDSDYQQEVRIQDAALRTQRAQLALSEAGSRTQEIKAAEQTVADAKADLDLKQKELRRTDALYRDDEISAEARDIAATAVKRAEANYERVQQNYKQILEGTRKEQIAVRRADVGLSEQNLKLAQVRLGYTVLRAPKDGVVLVRQAELGEVVSAGTPVVTVADVDHVWMRAYVAETDLGRVHWGQTVDVHTDTYPGKTYKGKIAFISSEAEFTPKSVETQKERVTLVYRIKIDLDNPNNELKPGMPADAVIDLAKAQ